MDEYDIPVPINNELEKRVADAFLTFDHHGNKTVDVREVGTILRFLGCVPTEDEINEIISATEFEDSNGTIHLAKFLPLVCQLLVERRMEPASPEKLLEAFHVLDPDQKGFISKEELTVAMMEEGEPFTQEEIDEMMAVAVDPQTGVVPYEYYLNQLMYKPADSIYELAEQIEAEKPQAPTTRRLSDLFRNASNMLKQAGSNQAV